MARGKKLSKMRNGLGNRISRVKNVDRGKALGALLIIAFVAFGSIIVNYYLFKIQIDILQTSVGILFIGGILAVLIEMRGVIGTRADKEISKTRAKVKRKKRR